MLKVKNTLNDLRQGACNTQNLRRRKEQNMRKMKKSRILWLAVWLCLALSGCAKTESASEIMAKVQAKQMESEAVQSVAMNGQLKMTTQGMTLEFPMDLVIQTQPRCV